VLEEVLQRGSKQIAVAPALRHVRPVVERVQRVLAIAAFRLDLSPYLSDREQLNVHGSCNRCELALALKAKIVDQLRHSVTAFESALPYISTDPLLEISVQQLGLLVVSHRAAAATLDGQSVSDIQRVILESTSSRGAKGCRSGNSNLIALPGGIQHVGDTAQPPGAVSHNYDYVAAKYVDRLKTCAVDAY